MSSHSYYVSEDVYRMQCELLSANIQNEPDNGVAVVLAPPKEVMTREVIIVN